MFWSTVTVIVAALIIIAFLVPVFAGILFGAEIARYMAQARHERMMLSASRPMPPISASGPVCPWDAHKDRDEGLRHAA